MKKILIALAVLTFTPATGFADSLNIRPGDPFPPAFSDKVVFSYVTAGTWRPAVGKACLKAKLFMKGFKTVEVSSIEIDRTKSTVTCTVVGEGRSK